MNKTITLLIIGVIFLAMGLMVLNSFMQEGQHGAPASSFEKARPQESALPARAHGERSAEAPALAPPAQEVPNSTALAPPLPKVASQPAENLATEREPSAEGVTVKTVPAQIDAGQTPPASPPPQTLVPPRPVPPKTPVLPEPQAKQTGGGTKNITAITVYATQEGATLRLDGDRPLVYKSMLLHNPDRLVLDFEGQWHVDIPGIAQNKFVRAIRVGRQADSTRMVVDLYRAPASYRLVKTSPQRLDVRLR
ncbi:MAG: AMIN domain-containing protein [Betaproteobacteria bacterium]|nr:AMIN domain-containing protein [Betaproteobacteria bacterium]